LTSWKNTRATTKFNNLFRDQQLKDLKNKLRKREYLAKEKKFENLDLMTALIQPVYQGQTFFELIDNTNLLEGDIIRIFAQINDRIGQIKKATTDHKLSNKMDNCQGIIDKALEGIYLV